MGIATRSPSSNGTGTRRATRGVRSRGPSDRLGARRRPSIPVAVLGVVLVLFGAVIFGLVSLRVGGGTEVLSVTRPLPAGSVLSSTDLGTVRISGTGSLSAIAAADEQSVLGRSVAVPVVAGTLLAAGELGSTSPLTAGTDEVALALRAGQYPPDLAPGAHVEVVPVPSSAGGSGTSLTTSTTKATVSAVSVAPAGSSANTIVSLFVLNSSASSIAALAAAGAASLVELPNSSSAGS
jgi:hypothetical protein